VFFIAGLTNGVEKYFRLNMTFVRTTTLAHSMGEMAQVVARECRYRGCVSARPAVGAWTTDANNAVGAGGPITVIVAPLEGRESKPQNKMEIMDAASRNLIFIAGLLYEDTVTIEEGRSAAVER
jgi:hypothetical protein